MAALGSKRDQLGRKISNRDNEVLAYINWRLEDDDRFLLESDARLRDLGRDKWALPEQRLTEYLRFVAGCGIHPFLYQNALQSAQLLISARPSVPDTMRDMYQTAFAEGKRIAETNTALPELLKHPAAVKLIGTMRTQGTLIVSKTGERVTATIETTATRLKKFWKRNGP